MFLFIIYFSHNWNSFGFLEYNCGKFHYFLESCPVTFLAKSLKEIKKRTKLIQKEFLNFKNQVFTLNVK